jgi:8-oxo-dGTP diphosphatase
MDDLLSASITPGFTLCFLTHGNEVLMLHRRFPPNQGLWNGVGGHIEPGETPTQAVIREVAEETGYVIENPTFAGLLTWDGFEIPPGGIAIFTAEVPHPNFINNHEGDLAWKPKAWACSSPEVVDNIHVFLPRIMGGESPQHYHFTYHEGLRIKDEINLLPAGFILESPFIPEAMLFEEQRGDDLLSFDKERLQIDVIAAFLSQDSYWAEGRSRETVEISIKNSVCLGIYHQGVQVGFARLVTDHATFAWLCDVFVAKNARGRGLGKWLVEATCRYCDSKNIKRCLLATRDAHGLYLKVGGFMPLDKPEKWLERIFPGYN